MNCQKSHIVEHLDIGKELTKLGKKAEEALNPSNIKKKAEDGINKGVNEIKNAEEKALNGVMKILNEIKGSINDIKKKTEESINKGIGEIKKAEEVTSGGIMKILNELRGFMDDAKKFFKKFGPVFESMGEFFEKFFVNFWEFLKLFFVNFGPNMLSFLNGMVNFFKNWKETVKFLSSPFRALMIGITIFVPIFGQLAARVLLLNGSMDKLWLMWFTIFPFSLVPAISIITGYIEPLKGGSPWDNMVWIPLIGTFLGSFVTQNNKVLNVLKVLIGVSSFSLAYWYKGKSQCTKQKGAPLSKIALDSLISYLIIIVLTVSLPYLPYIGNLFNIVTMIVPYGDLFLQAFAVFLVYVGTNVVNGSEPDIMCKEKISEEGLAALLLGVIIITFIVSFAPNSLVSMLNTIKSKL